MSEQDNKQVTPLDMLIARFGQWVEELEESKAEYERYTCIPDDVPCFVTRDS